MSRVSRSTASLAAALCTLCTIVVVQPRAARADTARFTVRYTADPSCPSETVFIEEITGRTDRARLSPSDEEATHEIVVEVRELPARSEGRVEIRTAGATVPELARDIDGQSCREVVSAFGLVAALHFDPQARIVAPPPVVVAQPRAVERPRPVRPTASPVATPWGGVVGAAFGGTAGMFPFLQPVGSVFLEVEKVDTASIRLAFAYGIPMEAGAAGRSARLDWLAGRLLGCPIELTPIEPLWIGPCAGIEAGRIAGEGIEGGGVVTAESGQWPWIAGVVGAQLRLSFRRVVPRLEGGLLVPFFRHRFVFEDPRIGLHKVAPVVGFLQLGMGLRFP
jgi:hypothetical protein